MSTLSKNFDVKYVTKPNLTRNEVKNDNLLDLSSHLRTSSLNDTNLFKRFIEESK